VTLSACTEVELIQTLVSAQLIQITPNVSNIEDVISVGIDFSDLGAQFDIELLDDGAVVHDLKLPSLNVVQVEVVFILVSGGSSAPILGAPTSLPKNEFPADKVRKISVKVLATSDGQFPKGVRLSVIVCSESSSTVTKTSSKCCCVYV
jgi:hypothetical protein